MTVQTSPSDVATRKPVGKPTLSDKQREAMHVKGGIITQEAQGMLLGQSFMGAIRSAARDLRNIIEKAWVLEVTGRAAASKEINRHVKAAKAAVSDNANLSTLELNARKRIASSATNYASQFNTIMKAMNGGFTRDGWAQDMGQDPEETIHVGLHVLYAYAKKHLAASGAGSTKGPKMQPFEIKLRNWLDKNAPPQGKTKARVFFEQLRKEMSEAFPASDEPTTPARKPAAKAGDTRIAATPSGRAGVTEVKV